MSGPLFSASFYITSKKITFGNFINSIFKRGHVLGTNISEEFTVLPLIFYHEEGVSKFF
jgi:hypothetical protein